MVNLVLINGLKRIVRVSDQRRRRYAESYERTVRIGLDRLGQESAMETKRILIKVRPGLARLDIWRLCGC